MQNIRYFLQTKLDSEINALLRPRHTSRFFCRRTADFLSGSIGIKCVGISIYRTLADFLLRLTAFSLGADSISAMFEKWLVHVTLMAIPHWLRYERAPTNYLDAPHTSRQGPSKPCLNSPHTSRQVKIFCRPTKNRLGCGSL